MQFCGVWSEPPFLVVLTLYMAQKLFSMYSLYSFPNVNMVVRLVCFATVSDWLHLFRDLSVLTLAPLMQGPA